MFTNKNFIEWNDFLFLSLVYAWNNICNDIFHDFYWKSQNSRILPGFPGVLSFFKVSRSIGNSEHNGL